MPPHIFGEELISAASRAGNLMITKTIAVQPRSACVDAFPDIVNFVGRQIVEHDRVSGFEGGNERLFDVVAELCDLHQPTELGGGHQVAGA